MFSTSFGGVIPQVFRSWYQTAGVIPQIFRSWYQTAGLILKLLWKAALAVAKASDFDGWGCVGRFWA